MRLWLAMMLTLAAVTAAMLMPITVDACPKGYVPCGDNNELCCEV